MPGPGMDLIGEEEKQQILEVIEGGYLFRYGSAQDPAFKAKTYTLVGRLVCLSPYFRRREWLFS